MGIKLKQLLIVAGLLLATNATARDTYNFNSDWRIGKSKKTVTLPRAWNEDEAYKVYIHSMSDSVIWYRKNFVLPESAKGKKVFIEFEGARQAAQIIVNGKEVGMHENGVMAFGFDITPYIKTGTGKKNINLIEVRTDNDWKYREKSSNSMFQWNNNNFNSNYGGLPKNVWLHITDNVYQTLPLYSNLKTTGVYVYAKEYDIQGHAATICVESQVKNDTDQPVKRSLKVNVEEMDGSTVCAFEGKEVMIPAFGTATLTAQGRAHGLHFWSWGYGYLYNVKTQIEGDEVVNIIDKHLENEAKSGVFPAYVMPECIDV